MADLPVGNNLVDQLMTDGMVYQLMDPVTITNQKAKGLLPLLDYLVFGSGKQTNQAGLSVMIKHCPAGFILGNIGIYLHFLSFHNTELMHVIQTLPCRTQGPVHYIDGLAQERRHSSALAMELRLSCTNPSQCTHYAG